MKATTITVSDNPLWNDQMELEKEMATLGIERFHRMLNDARENNRQTRTPAVRRLLVESHHAMVKGIMDFMDEANSGKAGRRHSAVAMFNEVNDVDLLAHLTIRYILDNLGTKPTLVAAGGEIAMAIEDEVHYRDFKKQLPMDFKAQIRRMSVKGNARYKRVSTTQTAIKKGVQRRDWAVKDKVLMGVKLIEIMVETTGLIRAVKSKQGVNDTPFMIFATEKTIEWLKTEESRLEWLSPFYMPTVIPPQPWVDPITGGYWSGRARRIVLVKGATRAYLQDLNERDLHQVYNAVNALQDTGWRINKEVFYVMRECWDTRSDLGVVPEVDPVGMPPRPVWLTPEMRKEDMDEAQFKEFLDWKKQCASTHDMNARMIAKRSNFSRVLWLAEKFKDRTFYYPYQLDFRGRVYPVPLFLHPQGDDVQRGLLMFAEGKPIGSPEGAKWLAIHGAGCWGVDKVSLEDRVRWIEEHEEVILAAANDPLSHTFWAEAEKPWQALAFCFEWAGYKRDGLNHVSHLPVQMDGTCNGLQNFSAILRDPIGGAAVNLIPASKPQDIYQRVADLVAKKVEADVNNPDPVIAEIARGWVGNVTRKVCKRPVMTLAYGAREFGFKQQVFDDTVRPWKQKNDDTFPWQGSGWEAATYMGGLIWDTVGEVVVAARQAMDWLQEAAREASSQGLPINWVTPTGFLVQQAYKVPEMKYIETAFQRVRVRIMANTFKSEKLDKRRQASGISPNWVHSLDAAHLMRTINAAYDQGLRSFCFIHDSYGTHAADAGVLADVLRQQFVKMYSDHDVLAEFRDALQAQLPESSKLPELPPKGALDLSQVLESPFFFA